MPSLQVTYSDVTCLHLPAVCGQMLHMSSPETMFKCSPHASCDPAGILVYNGLVDLMIPAFNVRPAP